VPEEGIRAFLVKNLVFGDGAPRWRIGLGEIAAGMDAIEDFAPPPAARYAGATLCIRGARSDYVQAHHMAAISGFFPAVRHAELAAGHWVHADEPHGFLALIEPFLMED